MSTIGYESWAVDLAEVGAVYPFQGWEMAMTVVGVIFWLAWHRIQFVREGEHLEQARRMGDPEKVRKHLERY
ncbi:MAG: hypothetical protein ACU0CB_04080 [Roseovarius sp.]|jgi:hypothetical protein|uniref:Heme exporter protein D n=1 Tax=Roseovarius mucosus DSM 17069 TaxID=1288298 RepID=A0A0A0HI98_9RHOB|nr:MULTISPECIES: hypothetical protein [Roseovarius]KGM86399.1 hypothetical protein rosmuc_03673 [Roseovarius mucosus DSM 17069]MAN98176.1 hypothetical protein [Roseovarius sp.]MBD11515.1 hypothetical protein [Roseovarius sp.]|tara:strand:- start:1003 stop:1218 length:216 start_codon:yes stop_codon:yes gene_type:complete